MIMIHKLTSLKYFVLTGIIFSLTGACKEGTHSHGHDNHGPAAVTGTSVFKTDAALQERMAKIQQKMISLHDKKADSAKVAKELDSVVKDIFATCKLEPAADKVLHVVLADVLSGVSLLKQKKDTEAMEKLHAALELYEKRFSPPGW